MSCVLFYMYMLFLYFGTKKWNLRNETFTIETDILTSWQTSGAWRFRLSYWCTNMFGSCGLILLLLLRLILLLLLRLRLILLLWLLLLGFLIIVIVECCRIWIVIWWGVHDDNRVRSSSSCCMKWMRIRKFVFFV